MGHERSSRCSRIALALYVGLATLAPGLALAEPKLQVIGTGSLGFTDNIYGTPAQPPPGVPERKPGAFALLSPSLVLASGTETAYHRLTFTHATMVFFDNAGADTASNMIDYRAFFDLSPRTDLVLTTTLVQAGLHTASFIFTPGESDVSALTPGTGIGSYMMGAADSLLSYDLGPGWRTHQGIGAVGATPILGATGPRTAEGHARFGVERDFEADSIGPEFYGSYTVIDNAIDLRGNPLAEQRQLLASGVMRWRHDWGRYFTSTAEAGIMRVARLNSGSGFWGPVGLAALDYATDDGTAEISYAHRVTTNPLLGQTLLVDEARLRGTLPLTEHSILVLDGSTGYQHGRIIQEDATLAATVDVILADVGFGWQATDNLMVGPRYQFVKQVSDADRPPLPLSFIKNTVLLGATIRFPADRDMPRPYRSPKRVDRSDEIRELDRSLNEPSRGGGVPH